MRSSPGGKEEAASGFAWRCLNLDGTGMQGGAAVLAGLIGAPAMH